MLKGFFKKLKSKHNSDPPIIKLDTQKIFRFEKVEPTLLNQQQADSQIIDTISSMRLIIEYSKDNEEDQLKLQKIYRLLAGEEVNLAQLKHFFYNSLCYQYYPVRSLVWKVIMGYLPNKKNKWVAYLEGNKKKYEALLQEHLIVTIKQRPKQQNNQESVNPQNIVTHFATTSQQTQKLSLTAAQNQEQLRVNACKDHPLNRNSNSQWNTYFKDMDLWAKIEKDVHRTRNSSKFFKQAHEYELEHEQFAGSLNLSKVKRQSTYHDAVSRILFLYAKTHPQEGYCQGMNEIAALIYYCFTNKNTEYERRVSESDAYFCFQLLIDTLIGTGAFSSRQKLIGKSVSLNQALKKVDFKLHQALQAAKVDLQLVSLRWFTVYLLSDYDIDESLLLWDGLLCSDVGPNRFLYYMCLSILFLLRDEIMQDASVLYRLPEGRPRSQSVLQTAYNMQKQYPSINLLL